MYTPPVTPWESVTPEVSDPTHISEHDVSEGYEIDEGDFITFDKRIRRESYGIRREIVVLSDVGGSCRRWDR